MDRATERQLRTLEARLDVLESRLDIGDAIRRADKTALRAAFGAALDQLLARMVAHTPDPQSVKTDAAFADLRSLLRAVNEACGELILDRAAMPHQVATLVGSFGTPATRYGDAAVAIRGLLRRRGFIA